MTMTQLLAFSYVLLAVGIAVVTVDLRAQGLTTLASLRSHMHVFRIKTVLGASAALLGAMGALVVLVGAGPDWPLAAAAIPACLAFAWSARAMRVA